MAGPRHAHRIGRRGRGLDGHRVGPGGGVAVGDREGDRRSGGAPVAHTGAYGDAVAFDLLSRAAPYPQLAAGEVGVDGGRVERETRRAAFDDRGELATVRFAGREIAEGRHARYLTRHRKAETRAGCS